MLAMMSVIVDYTFKMCFQLSMFYRWGLQLLLFFGVWGNLPLLSLSMGFGALITR